MKERKNRMYRLSLIFSVFLLLFALCMTACAGGSGKPAEALAAKTAKALMKKAEPAGSDWVAFGLARWEGAASENWMDTYLSDTEARSADCQGVFHERKYTENAKVILALTALGKDPRDVAGFNLLVPLADFEQTVFQGVNGAAYALLALDSGNYEIPANVADSTQATREMYVDYILSSQYPDGGWALTGDTSEADLTAMALQALAKYRDRADVEEAIKRGVAFLSENQNEDGGFTYFNAQTCESVSQTILALTELGISLEDPRFIKEGNTLQDALLRFRQKDGTFAHLLDGGTDMIATEQAFLALVAADRAEQGESSVYCMH